MTTGKLYYGSTLICDGSGGGGYVRPSDWLALPDMSATEGFAGLHAVWNDDANFCTVQCQGAYTVDWGDGTPLEFHASGVIAYHNFAWSSVPASTLTSRGYRQAIVVVTPQTGQNMTSLVLAQKHNEPGLSNGYSSGWLDWEINGPNLATINLSNTATFQNRMVEQCTIHSIGAVSALSSLFANCSSLQSVPLFDTSNVINMQSMFVNCYSLSDIPLLNTSNVTVFAGTFQNCTSLVVGPAFDTSAATNMTNMFLGCVALQTVPLYNTGLVTTMQSMFQNCYSLKEIPAFNTASVNNFSGAFINCYNLSSMPLINTAAATNMTNMFNGCNSLQSLPALDMSLVTSTNNIFVGCGSLSRSQLLGTRVSISYLNCKLSSADLDEIYTNLADLTSLPTQTITVTGNYGTAGDNPAIAIAKNWTVVG